MGHHSTTAGTVAGCPARSWAAISPHGGHVHRSLTMTKRFADGGDFRRPEQRPVKVDKTFA